MQGSLRCEKLIRISIMVSSMVKVNIKNKNDNDNKDKMRTV